MLSCQGLYSKYFVGIRVIWDKILYDEKHIVIWPFRLLFLRCTVWMAQPAKMVKLARQLVLTTCTAIGELPYKTYGKFSVCNLGEISSCHIKVFIP